jgi:hypothetical protein
MKSITQQPSQGNNHALEPKNNISAEIEILPESIKRIRKTMGLTVENFAWLFGVSPSSIFRYENTGVPTVHHGPLTRKVHLLNFWLGDQEAAAILGELLHIRDGLPTLAAFLEFGSVIMAQSPSESRSGEKLSPEKSGSKADSSLKNGRKAANDGPKVTYNPPTISGLASRWNRAFNLAAGVNAPFEQPNIKPQEERVKHYAIGENEARKLEIEAELMEAEARKLEAFARKCEAEARIAKAKRAFSGPT